MSAEAALSHGATASRILDGVLELLRDQRLSDLTLEAVAEVAAVSRQTVYRHFGSRDGLVRAVVLREEARLADEAERAVEGAETLEGAILAAVTTLLEGVRRHPLIDRLLTDEPEALLPFLTLGQEPVLGAAHSIVTELLARFLPGRPQEVRDLADVLSRLVISYTIAPGERTSAEVGQLAARIVHNGLAGMPLD